MTKRETLQKAILSPDFWLLGGSYLVLHLCTLKAPKLRVRWVRFSTETYSNLLNAYEEIQIPAPYGVIPGKSSVNYKGCENSNTKLEEITPLTRMSYHPILKSFPSKSSRKQNNTILAIKWTILIILKTPVILTSQHLHTPYTCNIYPVANAYETKLKVIKLPIRTGRPQLYCACFIISSPAVMVLTHAVWVISMK